MGKLTKLIIHETDTPLTMKVTGEMIYDWHTSPKPKGRGWSKVGYSDLFRRNGSIEQLVEYNEDEWITGNEITNGARGFNGVSRHICLVGGRDKNGKTIFGKIQKLYTLKQIKSLTDYVRRFLALHPDCEILGHYQVNDHKVCPGFDVPKYLRSICVDDKNIYKS